MKKTFKELRELDALIGEIYKKNPELRNTKFGYAYKRFAEKNYSPAVEEFQEQLKEIHVLNALENKDTKEILTDPTSRRGYKYSKEGEIKCSKEESALVKSFNVKEIECEPYISSYVPELNEEESDMLKGLLIDA